MAQDKKISVQFSVSEDIKWKLRNQAVQEKKALAVFLRDAVQFYLDAQGVKIDLSEGIENWGGDRKSRSEDD